MVHNKPKLFGGDGPAVRSEYHPTTTTTTSSSSGLLLPPRVPILPRLFSRSSDTWSPQQQQPTTAAKSTTTATTTTSYLNSSSENQPSTVRTKHSGDSHPSDCRAANNSVVDASSSSSSEQQQQPSTTTKHQTSSSSASTTTSSSSGLVIVHPSTLSYDDESVQSRNPNSVRTVERNQQQQQQQQQVEVVGLTHPPSPPQALYASSRVRPSTMRPQQVYEEQDDDDDDTDEKKSMDEPNQSTAEGRRPLGNNTTTEYRPRGSIRDVTHSWDMDGPNFPIQEIQRMKQKTHRLRSNNNNRDDTLPPLPLPSSSTGTSNNHLPQSLVGQSARTASYRSATPPPPTTTKTPYQQHWASLSRWNTATATATTTTNHNNTSTTSHGGGSKDSLSDVLGSKPTTPTPIVVVEDTTTTTGGGGNSSTSSTAASEPNRFRSPAAVQAEHRLRQDFHKSREIPTTCANDKTSHRYNSNNNNHVNTSNETDNSHTSQLDDSTEPNLILHDLCGEAVNTDDIAWRNALSVLAAQPELASIVDPTQIWTPLHICCLGMTPPPTYIVRALMYVYPKATYISDDGGRLTLHLVAASSADVNILQMIVQENPTAIYHRDDHGLTPLHLYIRNRTVPLTVQHVRILLGYTITDQNNNGNTTTSSKRNIRQRRGDHLQMSVQSVDQWLHQQKCRPITNLHHNTMIHEQYFDTYPMDVQVSLRQLSQWKHSNHNNDHSDEMESVEVQLSPTENRNNNNNNQEENDDGNTFYDTTNPAAIPLPNAAQYPIHMIVQRMIIEEAFVPVVLSPNELENSNGKKIRPASMRNYRRGQTENTSANEEDDDDDDEELNSSCEQEMSRPNQISSILRLFAASFSDALILRDKNGCTPLLQVMQISDSFPSVDIVEILIGKRNATGFEALPSWADNLPTHTLLMNNRSSSSDQKRYMNPAMVAVSETGQLPLHIAAEEAPTDLVLIKTIYECYPAAVLVQDGRGRTPLHLSFHNYRRITPDPKVIETLYTDRVANTMDDYGKIPFDLLVENAHLLPWQKPRLSKDGSSFIYRKLFSSSMSGAANSTTAPSQVRNFLPRLRSLPPWLRVEACSTPFVQELIVEELVSPWKLASILLDGVLLFTLIIVFRLQMKEFVDQLYNDSLVAAWYTYAVYATAVGRFMARILFGYFATTIGEFRHLCLFNLWYWVDVWAMLMSIVTSICLYGNTSDERLLVLGTATTILLWLSLVGYLSSWCYNMAIFTGGFLKIVDSITSPLLTAGMLVIAFAQCFYTLLQLDCTGAMATTPVCSVRDAYRVVYMLIRGESLVDSTGINHFSAHAIMLVASFLILFAIFLLAVLVTVLVSSSMLDFEKIALHSYWEPILGFILSTGSVVSEEDTHTGSQKRTFEVKKAYLWDMFTQTLFGGVPTMKSGLFIYPLRSHVLTWFIAIFLVPIWFVVGLVTLGLLWPPQLRRFLFRLPTTKAPSQCRNRSSEQSPTQLSEVQNELLQMKYMSYEKSQMMENELREMKELLIMAMQD